LGLELGLGPVVSAVRPAGLVGIKSTLGMSMVGMTEFFLGAFWGHERWRELGEGEGAPTVRGLLPPPPPPPQLLPVPRCRPEGETVESCS